MARNRGKSSIKFELPKYRKGEVVKTKDGQGVITAVRNMDGYGYWYCINDKFYSQVEVFQ